MARELSPVVSLVYPYDVLIASGGSLSSSVDLRGYVPTALYMPGAWTAASITLQASFDGSTFVEVHNSGTAYSLTAAASIYIPLDAESLRGVKYLKIRSGTSGTPVNQGADRTITLMCGKPTTAT